MQVNSRHTHTSDTTTTKTLNPAQQARARIAEDSSLADSPFGKLVSEIAKAKSTSETSSTTSG